MWDAIWLGARLATMTEGAPYGAVDKGALGVAGGRIVFAGPADELTGRPEDLAREVHHLGGRWVTPGLILQVARRSAAGRFMAKERKAGRYAEGCLLHE